MTYDQKATVKAAFLTLIELLDYAPDYLLVNIHESLTWLKTDFPEIDFEEVK